MKEKYTCAACKNIYEKGWSDEEADEEAIKLHGKTSKSENMEVVCDDCFNKMRERGMF